MSTLLSDFRLSARRLLRAPSFTAVVVLTLALGIGASTAIFSVVSGVLLRPLPYREPERLVSLNEGGVNEGRGQIGTSPANFLDWRRESRAFERLAAHQRASYTLSGDGAPEEVVGARVTGDFFATLGVAPALGRRFGEAEDSPGAPHVAIVSNDLWRTRLGGDSNAVGRTIRLFGEPYTVVGVMPAGFAYPIRDAQIWTPMAWTPEQAAERAGRSVNVVGRLAAGVTPERAQQEMAALSRQLAGQYPNSNGGLGAFVLPLHDDTVGDVRQPLLLMLGFVGFVLLIACANVASLQLARATTRRKEVALRTALGAQRGRIFGELLAESLLLAAGGGTLGVLVASWGVSALVRLAPATLPRVGEIRIDAPVLAFAAAVTIVAGVLFGLAPALAAARPDLHDALKAGGRAATGGNHRVRDTLVVAEIALSLLLLVGAGLMGRSLARLSSVHPGFTTAGLLQATISLPRARYEGEKRTAFVDALIERLRATPGVRSVAVTSSVPLGGALSVLGILRDDRLPANDSQAQTAVYTLVSPDYFAALGIPLRGGRVFTANDRAGAPRVAVVSERLAREFFPGENPIGRRVRIGGREVPETEIVGIVGDVRHRRLAGEPDPGIYEALAQQPGPTPTVVVRAEGDPAALATPLRRAVAALDPDLAVARLRTADAQLARVVERPRFNALLLAVFAAVAVALAAVGLYGLISYSVSQRTREFGVRMALGAAGRDVVRGVVTEGMARTALGVVLGVGAALLLSRLLASMLYGVSSTDPATFAAVALLLAIVALVATWLPARRAARVDPLEALRYE